MDMATQNSIDSYMEMVVSEELGEKQKVVYEYIRDHPDCSYNDVARALKQHHNTVTARIKELRDMGYIITVGSKRDEYTGKNNNIYRIRMEGDVPDDTSKDARPKIPRRVLNELKEIYKGANKDGSTDRCVRCKENGVLWEIQSVKDNVKLSYGDFLKIRNIMVVCEVIEQNAVFIAGGNFTVIFRLN